MSVLETRQLSFAYRRRLVVADMSITIHPGQLLAVVGPNGAGKSTLLRLLSGWFEPDSGQVLLGGAPVRSLRPQERARQVTLVPQMSEAAHDMPVEELVALGRLTRLSLRQRLLLSPLSAADQSAIDRALSAADVGELAKRPFR
ncbi:MAG: ATP-binding cassette domain-containing protein, partial [Sulfobacillus sp.]